MPGAEPYPWRAAGVARLGGRQSWEEPCQGGSREGRMLAWEAQAPSRHTSPTWVSGWTRTGLAGHWVGEPGTQLRGARPCAGPQPRGGGTPRCRRWAC